MLTRCRKANLIGIATAISLSLFSGSCLAATTADDIASSINKARVLAPGTQIKARVQGEQALISTFRNERADDKDVKIEALLVAKTVFEIPSSSITSVSVYFYNSRQPSEFKTVTIRSSDVKAFTSGQVGQDELLSSIEIKSGKVADAATAIESRMMLAAAARRDFQIVDKGEEIEVSCKMPALSDDDYKLEAFKIAQTAVNFYGDKVAAKRVNVLFFDPAERGKFKQVSISLANMSNVQRQMLAALSSLSFTEGVSKVGARDIVPVDGNLLAERKSLLERIKGLEDKGVGVAPFVQAFQSIDSKVATATEAVLAADIKRLNDTVSEQEKRYANAKTQKPVKDKTDDPAPSTSSTQVGDIVTPKPKPPISQWALNYFPMPVSSILHNPTQYLGTIKERFERESKAKAEGDIRWAHALFWFSEVLKANNRADEGKRFEDQARAVALTAKPVGKK
ncbi:MAG: hypothetical protein SGJ27_28470 [Candidatus Melainabacteria bacterium]|nr:hypothetical protein [Candidatus Melainabacteria bacterium]